MSDTPRKQSYVYLRPAAIRRLAKDLHHRVGAEFLAGLDAHVGSVVRRSAGIHNGGRKTLDATVLGYVLKS